MDSRKINFLISVFGVFGSLYFSEVLKHSPCVLCWFQRIALYPLLIIYAVALWSDDKSYKKYAFPFIVIGFVTAVYHNLIYFGLVSQAIVPCSQGSTSCAARHLELFGFITIPLLSLASFFVMGIVEVVKIKPATTSGGTLEK